MGEVDTVCTVYSPAASNTAAAATLLGVCVSKVILHLGIDKPLARDQSKVFYVLRCSKREEKEKTQSHLFPSVLSNAIHNHRALQPFAVQRLQVV